MDRKPRRIALVVAAIVQAVAGIYLVFRLLDLLREIIRDPSQWQWLLVLIWVLICGPIVYWAGTNVLGSLSLGRGERTGWLRSLLTWCILFVISLLGLLTGHPIGPLSLLAGPMLILLLLGSRAVEADAR